MTVQYLERPGQPRLAYEFTPPKNGGPVLVFLGGFKSDMTGTKASFLQERCAARGQGFLRFDYSGHGQSGGKFEDGTIGAWKNDARAVIDAVAPDQPLVLCGSSMGGWIALLLALEMPDRVRGLIGIAAAPDFTRTVLNKMSEAQKKSLAEDGFFNLPSDYSAEPYRITKKLLDDGERNCLLDRDLNLPMPVRLLHGMQDTDVPWQTAFRIKNAAEGGVEVTLLEHGDHRLARPEDLALLDKTVEALSCP